MATQNLDPIVASMKNAATLMAAATEFVKKVPQTIADAVAAALAADPGATGAEIAEVVNTTVAEVNAEATRLTDALFAGTGGPAGAETARNL